MRRASIGPVSDEGVASSFARFFLPIYMAHLPHFLHFIFADFWERKPVVFDFVNSPFYFCHFIRRQSQDLSSESYLTSKFFISFFFRVIYL